MWMTLIIVLSFLAGSGITLLAIWVGAVCIEQDKNFGRFIR